MDISRVKQISSTEILQFFQYYGVNSNEAEILFLIGDCKKKKGNTLTQEEFFNLILPQYDEKLR